MNLLSSNTLKDKILNELNQVETFSKYTGIPETEIAACLSNSNRKTNNLLRIDNSASLGFKWVIDKGTREYKIKMYDFADSIWRGDIIDIVGVILQLNPHNNKDFVQICTHILQYGYGTKPINYSITVEKKLNTNRIINTINVELRDFTERDLKYWKNVGLTPNDLVTGRIYAINRYSVNDSNYYYKHNANDVCYGYLLDVVHNTQIWKLYFVNRGRNGDTRARFVTNNIYPLEAMHELKPATALVITKSRGDCLLLRKLLDKIQKAANLSFLQGNITLCVTNFTTETARLSKPLFTALKKDYEYIFSNTDFDREGIRSAKHHLKHFGIQPLFLTNGKGGTKNYNAKDLRDYYKAFGEKRTLKLITDVIEKIVNDLLTVDRAKL